VSVLNALLRGLVDFLLAPFRSLPPVAGLVIVSFVVSIFMLIVFKLVSDQKRLVAVKNQITACLFEIRLFSDDLPAIFRAQGEILRHNLTYMRLSLSPKLVGLMILPLVVLIAQLQFHYGYQGLKPGQAVLVKVQLKDAGSSGASAVAPAARLEAPAGLRVDTPAIWLPALRELAWQITPEREGAYELKITVGNETLTKSVDATRQVRRRSPVRVEPKLWKEFLYPAEDPLPAASVAREISVGYLENKVNFFGWGLNWMIAFFILSIVFAFVLKGRFGVTI
jgi:hypothetical protein